MVFPGHPPILVAFDFDHTIMDCNSDTWIYRSLPHAPEDLPPSDLPPSVKARYVKGQWTAFMNIVFEHLCDEGVGPRDMEDTIRAMPLVPGMKVAGLA